MFHSVDVHRRPGKQGARQGGEEFHAGLQGHHDPSWRRLTAGMRRKRERIGSIPM
jgi:hypothetical protein